jgi:hypothetical protein
MDGILHRVISDDFFPVPPWQAVISYFGVVVSVIIDSSLFSAAEVAESNNYTVGVCAICFGHIIHMQQQECPLL